MNSKQSAVWFVVAALAAGNAYADVKTVTVEAEAAIVAGDPSATENEAKRQARRKAIEEGAGVLVTSNSIMRNYALVADEIATSAKGVITDEVWGPLQDGATANTKKIKLTAKVSPEAVSDSICTVLSDTASGETFAVSLIFLVLAVAPSCNGQIGRAHV